MLPQTYTTLFGRALYVKNATQQTNKPPLSTLHRIREIFQRQGIDMVGPLKGALNGKNYVVVAILLP